MKNNLQYLFFLLLVPIISSCSKNSAVNPLTLPTGTFSGYLEADHLNPRTNKRDTAFEWVTLTLSGTSGFTIKGDTTVHIGSTLIQVDGDGGYLPIGSQYVQFSDNSLSKNVNLNMPGAGKYHLNGIYICACSKTSISLLTASTDTLYLAYNLSLNQEPAK